MRAALTLQENGVRRRIELNGAGLVGRDRECQVQLLDPTVCRRHASLTPAEGAWLLRDLGSGNGTFLDGNKVDEALLGGGEALRFGNVTALFESIPDEPLSASQVLQQTLTQSLSIRPAKRARTMAAVVAIAVTVAVLVLATLYHRHASHPASRPATSGPAR